LLSGVFIFYLTENKKYKWEFVLPFFTTLLFSALLEFLQYYVPGRQPDLLDFLFNFLGTTAGILFFRITKGKLSASTNGK